MARKLQADEWLFAGVVALALFGVIMVYSASAIVAAGENHSQYFYVVRQGVWTLIGLGAMWTGMRFDYGRLRNERIAYGLLALTVVLLVAVFAFPPINGARRWIRFAGFSMQPSEISKLALAIFLARFFERRAGREGEFWWTFVPAVLVTGVLALLIVAEPDLGTALMLAVVCTVTLFTAGARLRHMALAAAPALVGVAGLLLFVPWRLKRMVTFLNPWADQQGAGYQVVQSLLAVGSGGVHGVGFTEGRQKMFFLPFAHSDFIFAVVGEELGLFGGLAVIALFGLFLWRGMRAALRAPDRFGMLLGMGIVTGIVAQALFNMSVVLALVPTKGIPLPFISYGGSSLVPTLFAVGVLLNISQHASVTRDFGFSIFDLRLQKAGASGAALSNQKSKVKSQKFA
ncbi:MAG: cell division protein FtsW [Acidobacteriota bacterium]|jgi:cell division protein FtsW|nr:cell division protein FtsW [Acidobacteriota bacterium]MDT7807960.1 cell division protein FtsW [Acidobacteriota bacterium]